jgi:sulfite reductase alpha subunit-like flavoprotein
LLSSVTHPLTGGAGIAPFKAFVEERQERMKGSTAKFGPFELFYGNRDPTEYAYGHDLEKVCFLGHGEDCSLTYISVPVPGRAHNVFSVV